MKFILLALCTLSLLATTGCFFTGDRDHSDADHSRPHERWQDSTRGDHPSGVDHREYPGDLDHNENH